MSKGMQGISCIDELSLKSKKVFLRLDLNTPLKESQDGEMEVADDTRIRAALPTVKFLLEQGAKVVIGSHLGRPQKEEDQKRLSLEPVARRLGDLLEGEVFLMDEVLSPAPKELLTGLKNHQVILLENLRFEKGETKNSHDMASYLSSYIEIYVNDAFGACHRAHASIAALASQVKTKAVGFLIRQEVEVMDQLLHQSKEPFVAILGGAKVSDKIGVFENLMHKVDTFIVGGAMAYTFLKAKGVDVGDSRVEKEQLSFAKDMIRALETRGKKLLLPVDHIVSDRFDSDMAQVIDGEKIDSRKMGLDIGPHTIALFQKEIASAQTIFWNGPMGVFERKPYSQGTFAVAEAVAKNSGFTVVGGGDSAAAAQAAGVADQISHISTGGGASLEYLQGDKLPGLEVLRRTGREGVEPVLN